MGVARDRSISGTRFVLALIVFFSFTCVAFAFAVPALLCDGEQATHQGTDGDDRLRGTPGEDVFASGGGDDVIKGLGGSDIICTGAGDDRILSGPGSDHIQSGDGADRIRAGRGPSDSIYAGSGNDVARGGGGRNLFVAGAGDDRMYGNSHYDNFESLEPAQDDRDLYVGRGRADRFEGDAGDDVIRGGSGRDEAYFFYSPVGVDVDLREGTASGLGDDTLVSIRDVVGSRHADRVFGTPQGNDIYAATGFDLVRGLGGKDEITDSGGKDRLIGGPGADQIHSTFCVGSSDGPTICQPDRPFPDVLLGGPGNDTISSGPGDDEVVGNSGDDQITGGDGSDDVIGGYGDDRLFGGHAAGEDRDKDDGKMDRLNGGPGSDICEGENDSLTDCESTGPEWVPLRAMLKLND